MYSLAHCTVYTMYPLTLEELWILADELFMYIKYPLTWWEFCILADLELLELLVYCTVYKCTLCTHWPGENFACLLIWNCWCTVQCTVRVYTMYSLTWGEFCILADLELLLGQWADPQGRLALLQGRLPVHPVLKSGGCSWNKKMQGLAKGYIR